MTIHPLYCKGISQSRLKEHFIRVFAVAVLLAGLFFAGHGIGEASAYDARWNEGGAEMGESGSSVQRVTAFLRGAEISRCMNVKVAPGKNRVVFGGLPSDVTPESVVAQVSSGAELISAIYRINHLEKPGAAREAEKLNEELKRVKDDLERNADRVSVLDAEEEFLQKNSAIGGSRSGVELKELRSVAEFYRTRLAEIAAEKFDAKREAEELQKKHDRLVNELGAAVDDGTRAVGEIVVELAAEQAGRIDLAVSYFVNSAGWAPFYEIRVADLDGPARLIGKGRVYQTTGEDWNDVPVVLSSGTPAIGGRQPELMPWYLDFTAPQMRSQYQSFNTMMRKPAQTEMLMQESAIDEMPVPKPAPMAQQAQTSVEFILPAPISVPSNQDGRIVEIMSAEMPAKYEHYSVRKLDRDVFLLARIEGWEKLNILEGEAGIFLGNTYVGTSFIDPRRADDTMEISLGRDSGVIVTRVKGPDFVGKTLLGMSKKATREWVITVRNTRSTPIDIRVLDQIPVSTNKSIKVEALEISGATHETDKGELRWDLHLEPGASIQKTVKYAVTYPKDQELSLE